MRTCIRILLLLSLSTPALAEHGCPDGHVPVFQGGGQNRTCVADYNLPFWQDQDAHAESEQWESRWGAIARDRNAVYGIVTDVSSEALAKQLALKECSKRGGVECDGDYIFSNSCAAVVAGQRIAISRHGPDEQDAIRQGMDYCASQNDAGCRVYWSGCSLPVRVR